MISSVKFCTLKTEVPTGEDNRGQYMKMMFHKQYQSSYKSNQLHKLIRKHLKETNLSLHTSWSTFQESAEKKIDDQRGRLTRLIKYTQAEPQELIKYFKND